MKCWYSAFNAQGSRLIIVVIQLGGVKIYVAAVEALRKKERQDETQFTTKIDGFLSFIPRWMLMYFFAGFLLISPCVWPNSGFWCCVFLTLRITLISGKILVSFRGFFEDYILAWWNVWVSIVLLFLKILYNASGKATMRHAPCFTLLRKTHLAWMVWNKQAWLIAKSETRGEIRV
jgi:hypothetical protein